MKAVGTVLRRQRKTRSKIWGTKNTPRVSVFRSNKHLFAQIIDDQDHKTVASISDKALDIKEKVTKTQKAKEMGLKMAALAKKKNLNSVVFDRGRYAYHGRVKAFAEGLREGGLKV